MWLTPFKAGAMHKKRKGVYTMKEYGFEDFEPNVYAYKPIVEKGRRSHYSGEYEINASGILTRLIQEAGRFCESFASDLFTDWKGVENRISAGGEISEKYLFGFRQFGVDHADYVFSRYEMEGDNARHNYRSMWRLSVSANGEEITLILGRVF